jgi:FAD/FMN-containing dehydrogenase
LQASVAIPNLRNAVSGRVIAPGDPGYDDARTVFLGGFDRHPSAIVRPLEVSDVERVVRLAGEHGFTLAVRSGGHGGAGYCMPDGGVVIDLHDMKGIDVDAEGRTAWAQTGLTAGEYSSAVGAHGLATGFGDTGSVGIGGITLGGGIGYLTRKHGLTIDSVIGAEVVTASGETLQVDSSSHPDLFWAIRGGGGNFGIVTRFKYRLHPVGKIVGGMMMLPATSATIVAIMEAAMAAPEELSAIVNIMPAPPMPFVPESAHGQLVAMILMCAATDGDQGLRAVAPFRAIAQPIVDMVRPMRYPEIFPPDDPSFHPLAVAKTMFIDHVDRTVADTMLDFLQRSDAPMRVAQLRVLGGAMARVPKDATAFAHRDARILVNVAAFYTGPQDRPVREQWMHDFTGALHQGDDGAYVSFLGDESEARVRAAYPGTTWERLAGVKARYDPSNLFRQTHNVAPAKAKVSGR